VNRRGVEVRRDRDDARAAIARLGDEVGVRDLGVDRVAPPDQDQVGIEAVIRRAGEGDLAAGGGGSGVVIADLGVHVEHDGVEEVIGAEESHAVPAVGGAGAEIPVDRPGAVGREDIDHSVGDVGERLVPAHAPPLALTASADPLQGVREPIRVVHALAEAASFLTATGIEVRHPRVRPRVRARLLLAEDDAVLDEHVPVAAPLVPAVDMVGALRHPIPRPSLPVEILPAAIVGGRKRPAPAHRGLRGSGIRDTDRQAPERQRDDRRPARAEKRAPADAPAAAGGGSRARAGCRWVHAESARGESADAPAAGAVLRHARRGSMSAGSRVKGPKRLFHS
jgi:hypothetical protein